MLRRAIFSLVLVLGFGCILFVVLKGFPSERMTPLSKDNWWHRIARPALKKVGLDWATLQVMRRTHATLMKSIGVYGKLVADQLGHTLDVNQNVYYAFSGREPPRDRHSAREAIVDTIVFNQCSG